MQSLKVFFMIFKACQKVLSCDGQWGEEAQYLAHQIKEAVMFALVNITATAIYVVTLEDIGGLISLDLKKASLLGRFWLTCWILYLDDIQDLSLSLVLWRSMGRRSSVSGSPDQGSNDVCSGKYHCDCDLRSYFRGYWGTDFTWPEEDKPYFQSLDGMIDILWLLETLEG